MKVAVAAFVKTPGTSPVKTRLSDTIGKESAEAFYRLSLQATEEMLLEAAEIYDHQVCPVWAVAEQNELDHPLWQAFPRIWTGAGELGDRLAKVYSELHREHEVVCLVGSDCPQLSAKPVHSALRLLKSGKFDCVIGPAYDGGFYLFASGRLIPPSLWQSVPYSVNTTRESLIQNLQSEGLASSILNAVERDVDTAEDLESLYEMLSGDDNPTPTRNRLRDWIKQTLF